MDVMVLVAHADDETLGMGGTIPKLVKRDWNVEVVILSDGVLDLRDNTPVNRDSAFRACKVLGVAEPRLMDFPDQRFDTIAIGDIASKVYKLGLTPDIILTHTDNDLNYDHRITLEVAKIIGRPRQKPVSIFACECPNTSIWNGRQFPANYYVDITDTLDTKINAFLEYENEVREAPDPWSPEGLRWLARFRGMEVGYEYAEAFQMIRGFEGKML